MKTRHTVAAGMAIAMAAVMTLQPVTAGNRQGAGEISGLAKDANRFDGIRKVGRVLPEQLFGMVGQLDRRDPLEPFRRFLPPPIRDLRELHVADSAQASPVAALDMGAKRLQRRLERVGRCVAHARLRCGTFHCDRPHRRGPRRARLRGLYSVSP